MGAGMVDGRSCTCFIDNEQCKQIQRQAGWSSTLLLNYLINFALLLCSPIVLIPSCSTTFLIKAVSVDAPDLGFCLAVLFFALLF